MANRATTGNLENSQEEDLISVNGTAEPDMNIHEDVTLEHDESFQEPEHSESEELSRNSTELPDQEAGGTTIFQKKKVTKKSKLDDLVLQTLENREIRSKERAAERNKLQEKHSEELKRQNDGLYTFFMSMYQDTKTLPTAAQLRIKRKLFEAVLCEEELSQPISNDTSNRPIGQHSGSDSRATSSCSGYSIPHQPFVSPPLEPQPLNLLSLAPQSPSKQQTASNYFRTFDFS